MERNMRRAESRKSYSWWWDSHISSKNSKWLADNLEEMDQNVKKMLKLLEEDGDSFAKKADMYYRRRPELLANVEEFYRMYRSLAERYDHLTGELRKNIPSDLQSQGSGISDLGYEPPSVLPSPDLRLARRRSGQQAAGFEFFLGSGGISSDSFQREGDETSSLTDSELDFDSASVNNYSGFAGNGFDQGLHARVIELENELQETKEKLRAQYEDNADGSWREAKFSTSNDLENIIARYEKELGIANNRACQAEEEVAKLRIELQKYNSEQNGHESNGSDNKMREAQLEPCSDQTSPSMMEELENLKEKLQDSKSEIHRLEKELNLRRTSEKNHDMQDMLESVQNDATMWKTKYNSERREVSKLQERMARLKTSLSDRDNEIRELKIAVSDAEQKIFPEKAQIKAEISRLLEERTRTEEQLRECESHQRLLEEEIRNIKGESTKMEERLNKDIEQLKSEIAKKDDLMGPLNTRCNYVESERDKLSAEVVLLKAEITCKDGQINEINKQVLESYVKNAELMTACDEANKQVESLRLRAEELEEANEMKNHMILEGAEEKREVIRQLCFALEHYRSGYCRLRDAVVKHMPPKRVS